MAAIAGHKGAILAQTGASAAFTNQACTDISPVATPRTVYQITNVANRFVDNAVAITVQTSPDGSTWTTVTDYTFRYPNGVIVFNTARAVGIQVRVSAGNAYPMAVIAQMGEWSMDAEVDMLEVTSLQTSNGRREYIPGLMSATIDTSQFWLDGYFFTKLTTRALVCLLLYPDYGTDDYYAAYTYIDKLGLSIPADGVVQEEQSFTVTGAFYYY